MGISDKLDAFEDYILSNNLNPAHIVYMGDDIPDYEPMRRVQIPACPANAAPEILGIAQYISPRKGGEGCVRDLIEKVMRVQGKWNPSKELETADH